MVFILSLFVNRQGTGMSDKKSIKKDQVESGSKVYEKPELTTYGTLQELTTGGSGKHWEGHPSQPGPNPKP